jgi:hypothetical protein
MSKKSIGEKKKKKDKKHNNKKKIKLMPIKNGNVYFLTLVSEIIY